MILLGVLRGLDDGGCLELLKALPKELMAGVDLTLIAVNAGGGGKKGRPSLTPGRFSEPSGGQESANERHRWKRLRG